jgi:hypothetical protein
VYVRRSLTAQIAGAINLVDLVNAPRAPSEPLKRRGASLGYSREIAERLALAQGTWFDKCSGTAAN